MKKAVLLLSLSFVLFSCSKNSKVDLAAPQDGEAKQAVTLSIVDFIQSHENIDAREDSPVRLSKIYYAVYDSVGTFINFQQQDSLTNQGTFGTINDTLRPGKYTVAMFASEKPLTTQGLTYYGNINQAYIFPTLIGGAVVSPLGQIFYKKFQLTVNKDINSTVLNVNLDRIVGKLQVEILDGQNIPNNNIYIRVHPILTKFGVNESKALPADTAFQYFSNKTGIGLFEDYFFGSDYEYTLTISYYNQDAGTTDTKRIEHVKVFTNQKTIIRGYLFGTQSASSPLKVQLNQTWGTDSTVITF